MTSKENLPVSTVVREKVATVRIEDNIEKAVEKAILLVGGFNISNKDKIIIKPNLSDLRIAEQGVTTSPELVKALIQYLRTQDAAADISIVESDHPEATADEEFSCLEYADLAKDGTKLVNLSNVKKLKICFEGWH